MAYDILRIASDIKAAAIAAQEFINTEDGGTCNFDTPVILAPRMTEKQASEIETLSGVRCSLRPWLDHTLCCVIWSSLL